MKKSERERAEELVSQMTVEEMTEQLTYGAPANKRLGIPAYNWWNEGLHGVARAGIATVFPQAIGLAAMFDETMLEQIGDSIATEARAKYNMAKEEGDTDIYKGLTLWSPNINIFRDPRWGRGHETYGEDPYLTSRLGVAFIKGLQGKGKYLKAAACAKHFAVHSGPELLRHEFDAVVSQKDLNETYLPAFETAVKEGQVESVMGAYNRVNGEPCCGSKFLLKDTLRGKWNYKGHVVSDCWALADFHMNHMVTKTPEESAALALKMGCDLNCGSTYLYLQKALKQGLITEEEIKAAAVHLFTTRMRLGMFDSDCEYDAISYEKVHCKEHLELAKNAAEKSIVLLKNDGILPLKKQELKTIAVIGPNAYTEKALYGNYNGDSDQWITNLDGIRTEVGESIRVFYSKGADIVKEKDDSLCQPGRLHSEAIGIAKRSDLIILCVGLDGTLEGEACDPSNPDDAGDKQNLLLPVAQRLLCDKLYELGKPIILVINSGSSLDLSKYEEKSSAIIQSWYSGERGGEALANILFGKCNPSARLPITFYYNNQLIPDFEDYSMQNRTYRYIEEKPWYPFGYGLSYSKFEYSGLELELDDGITGAIGIKNIGEMDGEEVVQAYLEYEGDTFQKPLYSLCYFKRVDLNKKEEIRLEFHIDKKRLESVLENGESVILPGRYTLHMGGCAPDNRSIELTRQTPLSVSFRL
ncbi:glycoside hydrolase family 3 N-terminal domain-containing protein [Anaeromicropila herbilytica]|uniref:Glycosyl hydrolase n=1 Tax=Anaeromicropila herbilytica TaxID=2785025 RepID=A0A7R7ICW3_9FIRM|nr:glycoside hydrolase family 3 N-terminal domain-containing protein [Anaeromicropila herbilytica]BCN29408.1 glycosyl hydrolase [Anaeromicropila herbilytica]